MVETNIVLAHHAARLAMGIIILQIARFRLSDVSSGELIPEMTYVGGLGSRTVHANRSSSQGKYVTTENDAGRGPE